MTTQLDTHRCKHCGAVIALIPRRAIVGRVPLRCGQCGVVLVIWPARKSDLDESPRQVYTESAPA